jgi:aspartate aminotransferase-like enzyme
MESLLVNTLSKGDQVLGIDTGKFGERWCEMAKTYGANISVLKSNWGEAIKISEVEASLKQKPDTKIVICQACETSTGVLNPLQEIGNLIHNNYPNTLFLVDGITALGALPLPMDDWHIDGLVGGSQKAFMLPTGLSFVSFSEKAWQRIPTANIPRFYFDIQKEHKANLSGETFFSSNVTLIRALDVVLDLILEKGLEKLFHEIQMRADFTKLFAQKIGFTLYSKAPSNSVTALQVPPGFDGQKIRTQLEEKFKITIMGGQDQAKGKIIRIGHMGHIQWSQMTDLITNLHKTLLLLSPDYRIQISETTLQLEMKEWIHAHIN